LRSKFEGFPKGNNPLVGLGKAQQETASVSVHERA